MKIAILGYSGAGKSTLARALGEKYHCDVLHLDTVNWCAGWHERNEDAQLTIVQSFLDQHDAWVIEGNYSRLLQPRRLREADRIILLLLPRLVCFRSVLKRLKMYKNTSRPDMTQGCPEKVDFAFAKWVLLDGRTKKRVRHYRDIARQYPDKTVILKSRHRVNEFLKAH